MVAGIGSGSGSDRQPTGGWSTSIRYCCCMSVALEPVRALSLRLPSPLEELTDNRLDGTGVQLLLKRDDLIHPDFPGNKWRKLRYNLVAARDGGHTVLLTFGGAYSNHLQATAAAGYYFGFTTIGVVHGEETFTAQSSARQMHRAWHVVTLCGSNAVPAEDRVSICR